MTSLFDASLISAPTSLPSNFSIRPLRDDDYENGYDVVLDDLAKGDPLTLETFTSTLNAMRDVSNIYYVVVITDSSSGHERVIGSSTLLVERKFLRGGTLAGHIEDVVVAPSHQGQKLGRVLIDTCTALARKVGCYKVILDCSDANVGFYEKCGYEMKGREMKIYL